MRPSHKVQQCCSSTSTKSVLCPAASSCLAAARICAAQHRDKPLAVLSHAGKPLHIFSRVSGNSKQNSQGRGPSRPNCKKQQLSKQDAGREPQGKRVPALCCSGDPTRRAQMHMLRVQASDPNSNPKHEHSIAPQRAQPRSALHCRRPRSGCLNTDTCPAVAGMGRALTAAQTALCTPYTLLITRKQEDYPH